MEICNYVSLKSNEVYDFAKTLPQYDFPIAQPPHRKVSQGYLACYVCLKSSSIQDMPKRNINGKDLYTLLACQDCIDVNTAENPLVKKSLARRLARKEKATRLENRVSVEQIPYGYFSFLYSKQKGLCFYTDRPLVFNIREGLKDNISTDRIIYDKPYEQGNIVFTIVKVNHTKSDMTLEEMSKWTPEWHKRIESYYANIDSYLIENSNG
jgi:hypothetical protein